MRIAAPITAASAEQALEQIGRAKSLGADVAELRLDYGLDNVKKVVQDSPLQTIVSCRPEWAGGVYKGSELDRVHLLRDTLKAGADFIELQEEMAPRYLDLLFEASKKASAVVIRARYFNKMPTISELLEAGQAMEADICKIAPPAKGYGDCIHVLKALERFDEWDRQMILFASGQAGRITRFLAPLYGAYLTYAYLDSPTSPGQIGLQELNTVRPLLRKVPLDEAHLRGLEEKINRRLGTRLEEKLNRQPRK